MSTAPRYHAHGGEADVLVAGPVTRDRIIIDDAEAREQPGGSAFYAAAVHLRLGLRTMLLTRMAARDRMELLTPLSDLGVGLAFRAAQATTYFENRYRAGRRTQKVTRLAPPLRPGDFQTLQAAAIQLGPLTRNDMPLDTVSAARARCRILALDAQGLLRHVRAGRVEPTGGVDREILVLADILKADRDEARLLTGLADPGAGARRLARLCRGEALVTLGRDGAVLAHDDGKRLARVEAVDAGPVADTTGCGDSFLAAYVARRLRGEHPLPAARFAGALSALKATRFGPFAGDEAAVKTLLADTGVTKA